MQPRLTLEKIQKLSRNASPKEQEQIERWLLTNVVKAVVPEDVLSFAGDAIIVGGRRLTPPEVTQLRSQVKVLRKMNIWNILNETVQEKAKEIMFKNSKSYEDMRAGKLILYCLDLQNNILKSVEKETLDEKMKKVVELNR